MSNSKQFSNVGLLLKSRYVRLCASLRLSFNDIKPIHI
jgi:hypothetical protein